MSLVDRHTSLRERVERRRTALTRAETRLEDAKVALSDAVAQVREAGYESISALRSEKERLEAEVSEMLDQAERMLA